METPVASRRSRQTLLYQVGAAVSILRSGGVVCVPTDTLYGLAAPVLNERVVERVYSIKGRPLDMPLPVLLADPADVSRYATDVPDVAWSLLKRFSPGPLTLVLRKHDIIPDVVTGGSDTVAVRVPDHWVPRAIVRELDAPITGTSANRSGMPGLTTAQEVREHLGNDIEMVIDGGRCSKGVASTVLDLTGPSPLILREGAVSRREIEEVCGERLAGRGEARASQ